MARAGGILMLFAAIGTGLVSFGFYHTYQKIRTNERATLLLSLSALVPQSYYDNDLLGDICVVKNRALLGTDEDVTVYRARKEGAPVAAILASIAPDGYNGSIKLLVAVDYFGNIIGVRVTSHQETPGLGDGIEEKKSNWIFNFTRYSLKSLGQEQWKVKRDGGIFDQFAGATITPRAVVKAVYNTLQFYDLNKEQLFSAPAITEANID